MLTTNPKETDMLESILILLVLLQIKHWYVDFVNQNDSEIKSKGIYGDRLGLNHSFKHGMGTTLCVVLATNLWYIPFAIIMGVIDSIVHYHIDWVKSNYGRKDITQKVFWIDIGLDQMAHQLTYIGIAYLVS